MPSFQLTKEPWIPVETLDGKTIELSLREVFAQAASLKRLSGNPLEVAVLYRLLIAILYRAETPKHLGEWQTLWSEPQAIFEKAQRYLDQHEASFDLYDPKRPFGQHPDLPFGDKPVAVLLYDRAQGNNPVFLDASRESEAQSATSAEIARALLVNFAFGGSHPDKSSPIGGNEKTMYAGPLCARLVALLEGENLQKTLLLNLTADERRPETGRPAWERPLPPNPVAKTPEGHCDRFTRQTRFVRLTPSEDGTACIGVALHMGERIEEFGETEDDPMIPLYFAQNDKKQKALRFDAGRSLWRSSHVLLNSDVEGGADKGRPIAALAQAVDSYNQVLRNEPVSLRVLGVLGNAQGPKTEFWRDETLPFGLSIVADEKKFTQIKHAVDTAEEGAKALGKRLYSFAQRYMAEGAPNPDPKEVRSLVDNIAPDYALYWATVGAVGEQIGVTGVPENWDEIITKAAGQAYRAAVDALPPSAKRHKAEFYRAATKESEKSKGNRNELPNKSC